MERLGQLKDTTLNQVLNDIEKMELPDPTHIAYEEGGDIGSVGPGLEAFPSLQKVDEKTLAGFANKIQPYVEKIEVHTVKRSNMMYVWVNIEMKLFRMIRFDIVPVGQ